MNTCKETKQSMNQDQQLWCWWKNNRLAWASAALILFVDYHDLGILAEVGIDKGFCSSQ
jgi:hypothetical protein